MFQIAAYIIFGYLAYKSLCKKVGVFGPLKNLNIKLGSLEKCPDQLFDILFSMAYKLLFLKKGCL